MSAKTCKLQKAAGNLRAKNYGHTPHDATCDARVHLYLLRTHTTPLGVCRVAGVRVTQNHKPANFRKTASTTATCNFLQASRAAGRPSAIRCCGGDQQNGGIGRARDDRFDNDSTGNDTS